MGKAGSYMYGVETLASPINEQSKCSPCNNHVNNFHIIFFPWNSLEYGGLHIIKYVLNNKRKCMRKESKPLHSIARSVIL